MKYHIKKIRPLMPEPLKYAVSAVVLAVVLAFQAAAVPARPSPPRLVNDFAGILDYAQRISLERRLTAFSDSTSNQIAVVTVNDLEGYSPAEYGTEIGLEWQVGSGRFDNGIVVLVKPKTSDSPGQVNISVGYGLEGAIPDSYAKRIINNEMIPAFQAGNYYKGIDDACTVLMKLASGEISEPEEDGTAGFSMWIILFLILFIVLVVSGSSHKGGGGNGGRKYRDDSGDFVKGLIIGSILNSGSGQSGRGGYDGGFGGGFGGGSFGGFGGGSFGGGGASGSW